MWQWHFIVQQRDEAGATGNVRKHTSQREGEGSHIGGGGGFPTRGVRGEQGRSAGRLRWCDGCPRSGRRNEAGVRRAFHAHWCINVQQESGL